jgi:hypothetical protein
MDLLSEIGPPGDLPVGMLRNLSQPVVGTLNENRTPFSITAKRLAVGEEPGCALAKAEDEGQSRVMQTTTTTVAAVAPIATLGTLFMLADLRIVLLLCRVAARTLGANDALRLFQARFRRATVC